MRCLYRCIDYCLSPEATRLQCLRRGLSAPATPGRVADVVGRGMVRRKRFDLAFRSRLFPRLWTGRLPESGDESCEKLM